MQLFAVQLQDGRFWHKAEQKADKGRGFACNLNTGCLYSTERGATKAAATAMEITHLATTVVAFNLQAVA